VGYTRGGPSSGGDVEPGSRFVNHLQKKKEGGKRGGPKKRKSVLKRKNSTFQRKLTVMRHLSKKSSDVTPSANGTKK